MNAERDYLLDELGDGDAPIGSKSWALWLSNEIRKTYYDKQQTGERLRSLIETFKTQQAWQVFGFLTWEAYCEKRLQLAAQDLDAEARDRVKRFAENATPLMEHASGYTKTGGRGNKLHDNNNVVFGNGTDSEYLTNRIARDRPDILERMKAGEYRSVRSAAIDAGIIDPDKTKRYQLPTDPTKAGRYLAERVDAEWMLACYDAFMKASE